MIDPLQRLYKTKMILLAVIAGFVGLVLLVISHSAAGIARLHWITDLPAGELGSTLFVTGLFVIVYDYYDGQDREERDTARLRRVLASEAPAIRDAVIDGFAFEPEDLARVATPEKLDQIITNGLALRLGDASFAAEIYEDVRDQAVQAGERWHNLRISISLSMDSSTAKGRAALFVATVETEYTVQPQHYVRRFAAVSTKGAYREYADDPGTSVWYVSPRLGVPADSADAFELVQFTANGAEQRITRSGRKDAQVYSVNLGSTLDQDDEALAISYTYRTLLLQQGNLLYLDILEPTRGVDIELDYSNVSIDNVTTLDFIASSKPARIQASSPAVPERSVSVAFDGWVFPKSGVAFVWMLAEDGRVGPGRRAFPPRRDSRGQ